MWPIFALAAVVLAACGSDSNDSKPSSPPPPKESASSDTEDAGTPPSAPSASASPAPSASSSAPPAVDSSDPFSAPPPSASPFPPCENKSDDLWKSSFTTNFVDQARFKQIIGGGPFCTRAPIRLLSGVCQDNHKFFPLILDPNSSNRRMIRFNLESVLGATEKCPSMLSIKEVNCHPTFEGIKDLLTCEDKPLLPQPILLGTKVSLDNLLQGDGNGDGAQDLLVQLSNGTGIYLTQIPTCGDNCGGGEWQPPQEE